MKYVRMRLSYEEFGILWICFEKGIWQYRLKDYWVMPDMTPESFIKMNQIELVE